MSDASPWEDYQQPGVEPWAEYQTQPAASQPGVMAGVSRALEANLPFVDRAVAGAKSVLPQGYGGTGQDYAANLAAEKAKNAQFAEQNPWTNAVGGLTTYAPAGLIGGGPTLGARIATQGLTGFGLGGLQGASNSPDLTNTQETGKSIAQGELTGGALGAAIPMAGATIGKVVNPLAAALKGGPGAADLAALDTSVKGAYKNVEDMGAAYSPAAIQSVTDKIAADAANEHINPKLNPKAAAVIEDLQSMSADKAKSGTPITLPELDTWRQYVNDNLSGLPEPKQARFGMMIRKNIDDMVNTAFPGDMAPMPVKQAASEVAPQAASTVSHSVPSGPAPTPMLDFLRRGGGLQDEGGDLASMGFSNLKGVAAKGSSKIIDKENGRPMDEGLHAAIEAGYMEPHETVSDFINKIGDHPTYAAGDEDAVAARTAQDEHDYGPSESTWESPSQAPSVPQGPIASAQGAADAISNARNLAQRQFKAQALAEALSKSEDRADVAGTGGNIENTTRQKLLSMRDKESWSPDELAQINTMIHGTPVTNTLRQFSRFGPKGNALMAALELGAVGTGNPALMAAGVGGMGAQAASALMRRNAQNKLLSTILAGGQAPAPIAMPQVRGPMAAALAANANLLGRRNQSTPQ